MSQPGLCRTCCRVVVLFALFFPVTVSSQSIWTDRHGPTALRAEILKPNLIGREHLSFITTTAFFSFRASLSKWLRFTAELPVATYLYDDSVNTQFDGTQGNLYLGFEYHLSGYPFFAEIGVRAPLVTKSKPLSTAVGFNSDFDRQDAFVPDVVSGLAMINYRTEAKEGFNTRLRAGGIGQVSTKKKNNRLEKRVYILYSAQMYYMAVNLTTMAGFMGRVSTSGKMDLDQRFTHQFAVGFDFHLDNVHPGLLVRIPISKNLSDVIGSVIDLHIDIGLE